MERPNVPLGSALLANEERDPCGHCRTGYLYIFIAFDCFFILWQIKRGDPFRLCQANYLYVNYEVFAGILSFVSVTAIMALDISRDNINTIDRQKQRRKY